MTHMPFYMCVLMNTVIMYVKNKHLLKQEKKSTVLKHLWIKNMLSTD